MSCVMRVEQGFHRVKNTGSDRVTRDYLFCALTQHSIAVTAQRQRGGSPCLLSLAVGYRTLLAPIGGNHHVAGLVLLVQSPCPHEQRRRRVDHNLDGSGPGPWPEVFLGSPWLQNVLCPSKDIQVGLI